MRLLGKLGLLLATALAGASAHAAILVDQTSPFGSYFVGGDSWATFTGKLAGEPGGYTVGSVANSSDVASASAILIALRSFNDTLSVAEIANISSALAAGKRVAIFGENSSWTGWDASIIGFASSGTSVPVVNSDFSGTATVAVANVLTAGVSPFRVAAGGLHTPGGTDLFDTSFATLWRNDNLLTILDVNAFDEGLGNPQFEQNVADWLGQAGNASAVPEPATWAMMIVGFGAVGMQMRRRRPVRVRFA